jgi:hypothetical protein
MKKLYKVWMFPCLSAEIYANTNEEAENIASTLDIEYFKEHTDMCEISAEESEEVEINLHRGYEND